MKLKCREILNISITIAPKESILEEIRKYLEKVQSSKFKVQNKEKKPLIIFTPNAEIINYAQKDKVFKQVVNSAQINIPDGAGINFAINKIHKEEIKRNSGVDFMLDLCRLSRTSGFRIGLIGGRGRVALDAKECLITKYPSLWVEVLSSPELKVVSSKYQAVREKEKMHTTYYTLHTTKERQDDKTEKYFQNLVKEILEKNIDILFVALGFPKQELFINSIKYQVVSSKYGRPMVLMAVGGSFDYISGRVKMAPQWMKDNSLEWLFRLIQEPWRLPRMIKGARFFYEVIKSSVSP